MYRITGISSSLTSLPPECLLSVISHLSPASYGTLIHTSRHFRLFFSTHAATICNTYILTHYRASVFHLHSKYLDGWLVPSHPATDIRQWHPLTAGRVPCGKSRSLSEPGPQFMCFLIEYDFEIQSRRWMADQAYAETFEKVDCDINKNRDGGERLALLNEKGKGGKEEKREENFTRMIGMYATRPFLRKLEEFACEMQQVRLAEGKKGLEVQIDGSRGRRLSFGLKERIKAIELIMEKMRKTLWTRFNDCCNRMKKRKRGLCFGEIEWGDELLAHEKKRGSGRRNALHDGMLWFYGEAGVLAFRVREEQKVLMGNAEKEETLEKIEGAGELTGRRERVDRVKLRMKRGMRKAMKTVICYGKSKHFELLD